MRELSNRELCVQFPVVLNSRYILSSLSYDHPQLAPAGLPFPLPNGYRMKNIVWYFGILLLLALPGVAAQVFDVEGQAPGGVVALRVWVPEYAVIKGVVVLSPGAGGDERGVVTDTAWQRAAAAWHFALAGSTIGGNIDYNNASSGTGAALDDALQRLATQSKHAEIANAPLCLAGFSNGGAFSFSYNWYRPERVIAFFVNKSGLAKDGGDRRANDTFAVLLYGEHEQGGPLSGSQAKMTDYFHKHRSQGARWALAIEWNVLHEHGNVDPLVRDFFTQAIRMRYPTGADSRKGAVKLRTYREDSGWMGDNGTWQGLTPKIMPFARFAGDLRNNSWLPNAEFAQSWSAWLAHKPEGKNKRYTDWPFDAQEAAKRQQETAKALGQPRETFLEMGNGLTLKLMLIPAGRFLMGSDPTEGLDRDESPRHEVLLTKPFYLGAYEVTQAQYVAVMGRGVVTAPTLPATEVAWYEADEFCQKLSKQLARKVRLPTEAEWEYACRAGTTTPYSTGKAPTLAQANYAIAGNNGRLMPVGSYPPNAWGLYEMTGNVWEWCADWFADYSADAQRDPTGPPTGTARIMRGGGWYTDPWYCRSAYRRPEHAWYGRINDLGFRVVVEIE